jgi:nicotinamidase-related amidase
MRGYAVVVPADCTASNSEELTQQALQQMRLVADAQTDDSLHIDFAALQQSRGK